MADKHWNRLNDHESEVDAWLTASRNAVYDVQTRNTVSLQKTLILCTKAVCEAIWKTRY